jgi:hypothetical protein
MPEMYGDLVTGLTFTVAFPFFAHKAIVDCAIQNERGAGPIVTCLLLGTTAVCALKSWLYRDRIASYTGYTFLTLFSMAVCYFEWPNRESKSLLLHFAWHLFTTSANISLSLLSKTVMLLVAISAALIVSYASSVYTVEKNLPNILGGAGACACVLFIVIHPIATVLTTKVMYLLLLPFNTNSYLHCGSCWHGPVLFQRQG